MAQSTINNPSPCYMPGDTITVTNYGMSAFGYVTSSTKNIHLCFPTSKSLQNISTIRLTRCVGLFRGINGYVNSISDSNHNWLNDFTVLCYKGNEYAFRAVLSSSTALTNVDNNTPIVFDGYYTFTLS